MTDLLSARDEDTTLLGFKSHLQVEQVPGEAVYLLAGRRVTALHGDHIARLAPLLDGTMTIDRLSRAAADVLTPEQTTRLVNKLSAAGLVSERPGSSLGRQGGAERSYWDSAGLNGTGAVAARAAATVHTVALGRTDPAPLRTALMNAGLHLPPGCPSTTADLTVVLCDDYLDPALREIDAEHRRTGRPWLPVACDGTQQWIGPFFGVPEQACWSCLADRLWRDRQVEAHIQRSLARTGPIPRPACSTPATLRLGMDLAALEASKWLAGYRSSTQQSLYTFDSLSLESSSHPVLRRPQCPDCGDRTLVAARVGAPVTFSSRIKQDTSGGGHRILTPTQLLERYGHLLDPVTGLVKEIRRDPRGPEFLNSFQAGLNPVTNPGGIAAVRACLRSTSGGKGTTALQARAGALAEALERHSGYLQGDEPVIRGSYRELVDRAVHPDTVQLYDPRQFASGTSRCDAFDDEARIDWTPVWSLTEGRQKLLPTALLYYQVPQRAGQVFCVAGSNGNAAGGSPEDAVVQGFLELVERDATALWWYNRTRAAAVDLAAFADEWNSEMRRVHRSLNRELWALDLTSDFGIPVFAALSRRTDKPAEDIMLGFGAHFDPRLALRRALTELNQLLPNVVEARADGTGYGITDPDALDWMRGATLAEQIHLRPDPARPATTPQTHCYIPRADLRADIAAAEALVRERGMELLLLDQTRPDVEMPVFKVVVPGLRPLCPRFAPGRLFDVPVQLGLLPEPRRYQDLNPIPLFL